MAASSQSTSNKKFLLLGSGIVLAIAVYTGGWFYAASALRETVLKTTSPAGGKEITGECVDMDFRGYPFRIGLFCSKVNVDDSTNGISASFGSLRSAAQVYAPNHIVMELDSPAEIRTAHGLSINAAWENLQSSLIAKLKGVDRTSTVIDGLKATAVSSVSGQTINFNAGHTEIHLRQNNADLDAAISMTDSATVIEGWPQVLPRLSTNLDVTLVGKAGMIDGSDEAGLYGATGELRQAVADIGEGRTMTLTGPFSFDESGYLSGKFKLEVQQLGEWGNSAKEVFPQLAPTIDSATKLLRALAGGSQRVSVDLVVDRGRATVSGFIPLGNIPPI
jgi:hypothetical protein